MCQLNFPVPVRTFSAWHAAGDKCVSDQARQVHRTDQTNRRGVTAALRNTALCSQGLYE
jgi:hypothetical protein